MRFALAITFSTVLLAACGESPPPAPVGRSSPPAAIETPPPSYPETLACNGVGGIAQLQIRIEPDGRVGEVKVQKSSGNADLDAAGTQAVRNWKFRAAMQAGKPVAQWIAVPMNFRVPQPRPERCFALDEQQAGKLQAP
jgi:protein TonB